MSDRLRAKIEANAAKAVAVKTDKSEARRLGAGLTSNTNSPKYVAPHAHCRICGVAMGMGRTPPICDQSSCIQEWEGRERQKRRLSFLPWIGMAIVVASFLLPVIAK